MRSKLPENALVTLLRQCYTTPRCQIQPRYLQNHTTQTCQRLSRQSSASFGTQRRQYQTDNGDTEDGALLVQQTNFPVHDRGGATLRTQQVNTGGEEYNGQTGQKRIAVLGGGITGLAAAHYLTRELPRAMVTIYEASERLGGWMHSKSVDVGNGNIVFEQGPRTLRPQSPAGMVTVEMVDHLNLGSELVITPRDSVAAQNRFIYYPDRLVKMPGPGQDIFAMLWNIMTEPVFKGLFLGGLLEVSRDPRPSNIEDESIGSFLERRLGSPDPGNNIVSAVLHGIYAGDIYKLSAKSLMRRFWHQEAVHGSIAQGAFYQLKNMSALMEYKDALLVDEMRGKISASTMQTLTGSSVYTFKQGIGALSAALEKSLRVNPNVHFKLGNEIKSLEHESAGITVKTIRNLSPQTYSNVISTISGTKLASIANIPVLAKADAVTVMVVNLYYRDPNLLPERGFGYLIPRSISFDQNPECALGVVFDSDATIGQDSVQGTKVTVMLGGHWWDTFSSYPDEDEGVEMAKRIMARHLGIEAQPDKTNATLQRECIPQYTVGHEARLKMAHYELLSSFKGKVAVAGSSYTGVGLNDCVRAARDVVLSLKKGEETTGLQEFVRPREWVQTKVVQRA